MHKRTIFGAILFFVSIWLGCYLMWEIGVNSWKSFPMFITTVFSCLGGIVLFMHGIVYKDRDK